MWISAAAVIITFLVILEPVDEVEAGQSRLVIHTPQRIKTVHKYHTSEIYAKEFGHGEWYYRKKKPRGFRWGHPSHRVRFRKGHHRKVGTGTPFIGGKSYGLYNYAKNYRNWAPTRRPISRYRNSYAPNYNSKGSQEDTEDYSYQSDSYEQEDGEYSSNESRPSLEDAVKQIDYYAKRNRDFQRGSIYDSVSKSDNTWNRGGNQDTSYQQDNHAERYSTLPDEFINSPNSNQAKGYHSNTDNFNRGQNLRSKNQGRRQTQFNNNFGNNRASVFNTRTGDRQGSGYNNHHLISGQESRFNGDFSSGRKGNRFKDQNSERGHESQFNNHDNFHNQGGNHNSRGESGERYRDQHSGHGFKYNNDNFNTEHDPSYNSQYFGTLSDFGFTTHVVHSQQHPANNIRNTHDSHFSNSDHYNTQPHETRNDVSFNKGTVLRDIDSSSQSVRTQRESEGGIEREISITSSRPQSEDAYLKAFRAFSFRKSSASTPVSGGQTQSNSASVGRGPSLAQKSSSGYNVRNSDHWQDPGDGHHNNDHDIGFFEGLEDVNDGI